MLRREKMYLLQSIFFLRLDRWDCLALQPRKTTKPGMPSKKLIVLYKAPLKYETID